MSNPIQTQKYPTTVPYVVEVKNESILKVITGPNHSHMGGTGGLEGYAPIVVRARALG